MDVQAMDALAGEIGAIDGAGVPGGAVEVAGEGGAPEAAPVAVDPLQESREMWAMVFAVVGGIDPLVDKLYPAERVERIAQAWVPLAQKRGWDLAALMGKWGPEIMFAVAVIPPEMGRAVIAMIRVKLGRKAPDAEAAKTAPKADRGVEAPEAAA